MSEAANYTVTTQDGAEELLVRVEGRVLLRQVVAGRTAWQPVASALETSAAGRVVLDLTDCEIIDSAGLGVLMTLRDAAKSRDKVIVLRNPNDHMRKVFLLARFDKLFKLEDTRTR